ncbi:hypothetical protein [Streptomyces fragilis]|uniref:Integral membrane protein n=1 Tax=Streptomyces fragilis TaxID=67301 RepID=A0ABV2YLL3_9ACTN|nr:hypothetical protein [Streptomyces fragilis]
MTQRPESRWQNLADELPFQQLDIVRRQAEGWRNGLTGLTGLLTAVLVLKGRETFTGLPSWAVTLASCLIATGFLLLVAGTLLAVRASHGRRAEDIVTNGADLEGWTKQEAKDSQRALVLAVGCFVAGVLLVASSVGVAWTTYRDAGPDPASGASVRVTTSSGAVCGRLAASDGKTLRLLTGAVRDRKITQLPMSTVLAVAPVPGC